MMPRGKKNYAAQLPRNYPHHGVNSERGKMSSLVAIWEAFQETIRVRVIESQKLPRDNGESIFAARHQDVSQGPLGSVRQISSTKITEHNSQYNSVRDSVILCSHNLPGPIKFQKQIGLD